MIIIIISQLYEICSPKFPTKWREYLFENSESDGFVDAYRKDLVKMALKYKNGRIKLNGPEIQNILKNRLQKNEISKCITEIDAIIRFLEGRVKRINEIGSDQHLINPLIKECEENGDQKKYCLYYFLTFMAGARRQIFMAFAVFLLVKRFDFSVQDVTILFLINNVIKFFYQPHDRTIYPPVW